MSTSLPAVELEILEESRVRAQRLWYTVVHDDPVNTMSYVTQALHSYFGLSLPVAEAQMMQVHATSRAVVSRGACGHMGVDVTAVHGYGLRATIELVGDDASVGDSSGGR